AQTGNASVFAALDSAVTGRKHGMEPEGCNDHDSACCHRRTGARNFGTADPSRIWNDSEEGGSMAVTELGLTTRRVRVADFIELTKPRITLMVLITTIVGFYMGTVGSLQLTVLLHTIIGTTLVAAGASSLNQYLERDLDSRMVRTRSRPL